jgi:hypothetical protein
VFERLALVASSPHAHVAPFVSGGAVAVKKIDTRKVPPEIVEEFCQEADIMRRLRHPSLTLFLGVW